MAAMTAARTKALSHGAKTKPSKQHAAKSMMKLLESDRANDLSPLAGVCIIFGIFAGILFGMYIDDMVVGVAIGASVGASTSAIASIKRLQ